MEKKVENENIKRLCLFAQKYLNVDRLYTKKLYDMIAEIILNTRHHAYSTSNDISKWYAYAWYDKEDQSVRFTLLDTGDGIPTTVRKNWKEKLLQLSNRIGIGRSQDSDLIESVLNGDFRTQTQKPYRGRGIPMIQSYDDDGYTTELIIISNRGYVCKANDVKMELSVPLQGTLYAWRLKK